MAKTQPAKTAPTCTPLQAKFARARDAINDALIEREGEVEMVLVALIARENPLLVGPPGTAKSLLLDSVSKWVNGSTKKFSVLFTKFTCPEEVFGPVSVTGLKEDKYRRITTGMLPEADVAFVDEVFKGSSAISNTLLKIMNERKFSNGDGTERRVPLLMLMAASNEWPSDENGGKELGAMFDRFLLRKKVLPVRTAAGRKRLLFGDCGEPAFAEHIDRAELDQAHDEAMALELSQDAVEAFEHIVDGLRKDGISPGDRRLRKSVGVCRAAAYLAGKTEVEAEDLAILQHVLWDDPTEQPERTMKVVLKNATPLAQVVNDILSTVESVVASCVPAEAVPKLQSIKKELDRLPASTHKAKAVAYVTETMTDLYNRVIGIS